MVAPRWVSGRRSQFWLPPGPLVFILHMWRHQLRVGRAPRWHPRSFPKVSVLALSFQKLFDLIWSPRHASCPLKHPLEGSRNASPWAYGLPAGCRHHAASLQRTMPLHELCSCFFHPKLLFFLSLERRAKGSFEVSKCPETQQGEHLALNQAQGIPALGQGLHRGIVGRALHVSKRKLQKPLKKKSLQIKSCTEAVKPPLAESPAPCVQKKGA